jgi:asparagine synthase (glutamine-hydrolysing)
MCGICGIVYRDRARPVEPATLAAMARTLEHRGPDGEGFHVDRNAGFGHRRLSIIDLSDAGRQPMTNEDGRYWITFNGEIYNYRELRQGLVSRGHCFASQTDTEVVLHLFEESGPACLERLNGMFAFAIWDAKERSLFAARDRFGIKPFYFSATADAFVFGSEIKAILASGLVRAEPNPSGVADYITFQFTLGEKTLFRQVFCLKPGECLTLRTSDFEPRTRQYWNLDFNVVTDRTERDFQDELRHLLGDAIRLQLRSDVPVGAHLSGGLDSTTVTALAASQHGSPFHTFSGGFTAGSKFDETPYARLAAQRVGTVHHEVFGEPWQFVDLMPRLTYMMDEPAAGPGLFPQFLVSRLAREHVKVVLGGQGGDEIFGGYVRYLIAYFEASLRGAMEGNAEDDRYVVTFESILPNLSQLKGYEPLLQHFWKAGLFESPDRRYLRLIDRGDSTRDLMAPAVWASARDTFSYEEYRSLFDEPECHSLINKMTRFDLKTLLPALLHVEDRTSMAVSLESRVPLLDHRIVELVESMPPKIKFKGGRSKHVFREVITELVPPEISGRTDKMGFPVPLSEWCRKGPVRDFAHDVLLGARARERGMFDLPAVERLMAGEQDYGRGIWGLLSLELWMQTFIDRPAAVA